MLQTLDTLYLTHPFWVWLAVGAIFLAAEVPTASGYLLWPAASAGAVAVLLGAWQSIRDERTSRYEPATPQPRRRAVQ